MLKGVQNSLSPSFIHSSCCSILFLTCPPYFSIVHLFVPFSIADSSFIGERGIWFALDFFVPTSLLWVGLGFWLGFTTSHKLNCLNSFRDIMAMLDYFSLSLLKSLALFEGSDSKEIEVLTISIVKFFFIVKSHLKGMTLYVILMYF